MDTSKMAAEEVEQMVECGKLYLKVCEYCGKNYYSGSPHGKYCCDAHRRKDTADKSRHIRVCEKCGKEFALTGGRSRARYCVDCQPEYHKKNEVCAICGTPLPKNRGKYCCDLVSIAKAALEHHTTYGKYVEMLKKAHEHGV